MARAKKRRSPILMISLIAHGTVGAALALVPQQRLREVVAIALNEAPPKQEKKPEPPKEPPKPQEPRAARAPSRSARPAAAVQPSAASGSERASAFTDLGLTLDANSSDGLAVPVAAPAVAAPAPAALKLLKARAPSVTCTGDEAKPRPLELVRPSYTEQARKARVEGRVRLELALDEHGQVTSAKVLEGLGHGLDEAALAAAKRVRFSPAMRCNRPVAAPFVLAMRFLLGG